MRERWLRLTDECPLCAEESPVGNITTTEMRTSKDKVAARIISLLPRLSHRLPHDFFDGGNSVAYLMKAGFAKRNHAVVNGFFAKLQSRSADQD